MEYVIANKDLSRNYGFSPSTHRTNENSIILNEKEITNSVVLSGNTIQERIKMIDGTLYSHSDIIKIIKEGGWDE